MFLVWFQGPLIPKSVDETFAHYTPEERAFIKLLKEWLPEEKLTPNEFCDGLEKACEEVRVEPIKFPDPDYLVERIRGRISEIATGLFDQTLGDEVENYLRQSHDA